MLQANSYLVRYEVYGDLKRSPISIEYKFTSIGTNGKFPIAIQFDETDDPDVFHLAFGLLGGDGQLNDNVRIGNGDRNRILATVAKAIVRFIQEFPRKIVVFTGSTPVRTRLYRMAISEHHDELTKNFDIFGIYTEVSGVILELYEKQKPYAYFAVQRKNYNLNK